LYSYSVGSILHKPFNTTLCIHYRIKYDNL
jgi:hypothetical protein